MSACESVARVVWLCACLGVDNAWIPIVVIDLLVLGLWPGGILCCFFFFFFQAEDGIRDWSVTGVQTCALPISQEREHSRRLERGTRRAWQPGGAGGAGCHGGPLRRRGHAAHRRVFSALPGASQDRKSVV